jgi:hypothetical protein
VDGLDEPGYDGFSFCINAFPSAIPRHSAPSSGEQPAKLRDEVAALMKCRLKVMAGPVPAIHAVAPPLPFPTIGPAVKQSMQFGRLQRPTVSGARLRGWPGRARP